MPGGNSTARPNNRKENQAMASINSRRTTMRNIYDQMSSGDISKTVGKKRVDELLESEGAKKDYATMGNRARKSIERKTGKRLMVDKSTPKGMKGTRKPSKYNKGGYCGASNPAARPVKK